MKQARWSALLPILVFLVLYLGMGIVFEYIMGISMGAQPLIGFNCGARKWTRVLSLLKWSCLDGAICATVFFLLCELMPGPIVELFGVTGDLREFSILSLRIYMIWMPFIGYQAVASSYFQSSGQPLQHHKQQSQQQCPQPFHIIELHDKLAEPVGQATGNANPFQEIIARPQEQLILLLVRQGMGVKDIPKQEYADAHQHRQHPVSISP